MGNPIIEVQHQPVDGRSNQTSCSLKISAQPNDVFKIMAICPRLQKGAEIVETVDTAIANSQKRRRELIEHLDQIAEMQQIENSADFRARYATKMAELLREAFTVQNILGLYARLMMEIFSRTSSLRNMVDSSLKKVRFEIFDLVDARAAREAWLEDGDPELLVIYDAKVDQLARLESELGSDDSTGIGEVDAMSPLTSTYVLKFRRGWVNRRRYQLALDVEYQCPHLAQIHAEQLNAVHGTRDPNSRISTTSTTVDISPYPMVLSLIAVLGAILGASVELLLDGNFRLAQMAGQLDSASLPVAAVIAVVFFNVYENIKAGASFELPVDWRSAMLIGTVCGLAHDRIIEAFKALIA